MDGNSLHCPRNTAVRIWPWHCPAMHGGDRSGSPLGPGMVNGLGFLAAAPEIFLNSLEEKKWNPNKSNNL